MKLLPPFQVGQPIRVSDGPFVGFTGVVEKIDEDRAGLIVAVALYGRTASVQLTPDQVRAQSHGAEPSS